MYQSFQVCVFAYLLPISLRITFLWILKKNKDTKKRNKDYQRSCNLRANIKSAYSTICSVICVIGHLILPSERPSSLLCPNGPLLKNLMGFSVCALDSEFMSWDLMSSFDGKYHVYCLFSFENTSGSHLLEHYDNDIVRVPHTKEVKREPKRKKRRWST